MIGVSLAPQMFLSPPPWEHDRQLLAACGGTDGLLRSLRASGVTHVELRGQVCADGTAMLLNAARALWAAGFSVTLHWGLPEEERPFAESCAALLPLLEAAKEHQPYVTVTVHSRITGNDADKAPAAEKTNRLLRLWSADAQRYGYRLALELNRDKKDGDPSVTCEGVLAMLEGTDPENVGICFDFGHYYSNTREDSRIPPKAFLERVIHTHIHALENGVTHHPFGPQAALPLDAYVQALAQVGYPGVYDLELDFVRYPERDLRGCLRDSLVALKGVLYRALPRHEADVQAVGEALRRQYPAALAAIAEKLSVQKSGFDKTDCFYTVGPSGQVFCVGEHRFAVDVAIRDAAARAASAPAVRALLASVPVVFITHEHDDHFDTALLRQLADLPCIWVIGDNLTKELLALSGLRPEQMRLVRPGDVLEVCGIGVEVYEGRHFGPDGAGVPAVMYQLTVDGKRIFLPADVRDYGADRMPLLYAPDMMIANVWLGRSMAECTPDGAYEEFCDYVAHFAPKQVFLGHIWEHTRDAGNMWRWEHTGRVMDGLVRRLPGVPVTPLQLFRRYEF